MVCYIQLVCPFALLCRKLLGYPPTLPNTAQKWLLWQKTSPDLLYSSPPPCSVCFQARKDGNRMSSCPETWSCHLYFVLSRGSESSGQKVDICATSAASEEICLAIVSYQGIMPPNCSHLREGSGFFHPDLGQWIWGLMIPIYTALHVWPFTEDGQNYCCSRTHPCHMIMTIWCLRKVPRASFSRFLMLTTLKF